MRDSAKLGALAIFLTLGIFSWEWGKPPNMITSFPPIFFQGLAVVCFVIAFAIAIWLMVSGGEKGNRGKTGTGFNITIDSRDFISMDIKKIKAVFDGLEKVIKHTQEKQNNEERKKR